MYGFSRQFKKRKKVLVPNLHGKNMFRRIIFGLVGKQKKETDVCLNVMFVAGAALTFESPTLPPLGFVRCESLPGIRLSQSRCCE